MIVGLLGMSILAVIFGHIALRQIKRSAGWITGKGFAVAGVVLGWIQIAVIAIVATILVIAGVKAAAEKRHEDAEATAVEAEQYIATNYNGEYPLPTCDRPSDGDREYLCTAYGPYGLSYLFRVNEPVEGNRTVDGPVLEGHDFDQPFAPNEAETSVQDYLNRGDILGYTMSVRCDADECWADAFPADEGGNLDKTIELRVYHDDGEVKDPDDIEQVSGPMLIITEDDIEVAETATDSADDQSAAGEATSTGVDLTGIDMDSPYLDSFDYVVENVEAEP